MENNLTMWRKIWKNKVIQSEEFNIKESQCYNVSVSINHHEDLEKMLWSVIRSPMGCLASFLNPDDGLLKPKRYNIDFLSY